MSDKSKPHKEPQNQEEFRKRILEDIKQTGFTTELRIGSKFQFDGWDVRHAQTYTDYDGQQSREIDLIASAIYYDEEVKFRLQYYLVIETKYAKNPWVIFTQSPKETELPKGLSVLHYGSGWRTIETYGEIIHSQTVLDSSIMDKNNFRFAEDTGIAFKEAFAKNNKTSQIYSALISSSKAAWHHQKMFAPDQTDIDTVGFSKTGEIDLAIYIPVVIVTPKDILYECSMDIDGEFNLQLKPFIPCRLNYSSPNYKQIGDVTFYPDVLEEQYLDSYLHYTDKWIKSMFEGFKEQVRQLRI